jgi:hypothetical protein
VGRKKGEGRKEKGRGGHLQLIPPTITNLIHHTKHVNVLFLTYTKKEKTSKCKNERQIGTPANAKGNEKERPPTI